MPCLVAMIVNRKLRPKNRAAAIAGIETAIVTNAVSIEATKIAIVALLRIKTGLKINSRPAHRVMINAAIKRVKKVIPGRAIDLGPKNRVALGRVNDKTDRLVDANGKISLKNLSQ